MRFIIDQDVYRITVDFLRSLGHDVVTAGEIGLAKATDLALLKTAQAEKRILVTRDKDFGAHNRFYFPAYHDIHAPTRCVGRLRGGTRAKVRFIHLNRTNPALDPAGEARRTIEQSGARLAEEGEIFDL